VRALGITDRKGFMALFSTHPPMEERIARLRERAA
jgi:Zn-dependent protease with chaperone function